MLKYILMIIKVGWFVVYVYPSFLYYRLTKNKTPYEKRYEKAKKTIIKLAKLLNVEYHIEGLEKLDPNKNYYIVSNHQSLFDALIYIAILPDRKIRCIAKEESAKMPVAGKIIRSIDCLLLDRDDPRQALKLMKKAGSILKEGKQSVLIFPEGTRTKNKDKSINEFKPGSLKPAFYGEVSILPVCLVDTYQILSSKIRKKKYHVQISFLDPISYEEINELGTNDLAIKLKEDISSKYEELRKNTF